MMTLLYQYPEKALVNQLIPKEKIYQTGRISSKLKQNFVDQIKEIRWRYKLSQQTINLMDHEFFKEFEIIQICLKRDELNSECLMALDKVIPNPIIFEVITDSSIWVMAAYKTVNQTGNSTTVKSGYFSSTEYSLDEKRAILPSAISLEELYHAVLKSLMPVDVIANQSHRNQSIDLLIAKNESLRALDKEIASLEKKILREKQFNRKVEMNAELKQLKEKQISVINA